MKVRVLVLMFVFVFPAVSVADRIDDMLFEVSSKMNKEMSEMYIDKITKLRNTLYRNIDKREFMYFCRITDSSLDKNSIDWSLLKKIAINTWCTTPSQKPIFNLTTVTYSYTGYDGTFFHEYNFSKDDCNDSSNSKLEDKDDANLNSATIDVGGKDILVTAPYGFRIVNDQELISILKSMSPAENIEAEVFISPDVESERWRQLLIATFPGLKDKNISKRSFKFISKSLVEQQHTLLNKVKDKVDESLESGIRSVNDKYDLNAAGSIDEMTSFGVFIDKENVVSMAAEVKGKFSMDGYSDSTPQIVTMSFVRVKNRLIAAYVYSDYIDGKDVVWAKSKTKEFVSLLLKENKY